MKPLLFCVTFAMALALPGELLAQRSWVPPYGPPLVVMGHDREPAGEREHGDKDVTVPDNECNENHNLQPDGDSDCDDPKIVVAEPDSLSLLVLGVMVLYGTRRKWNRS